MFFLAATTLWLIDVVNVARWKGFFYLDELHTIWSNPKQMTKFYQQKQLAFYLPLVTCLTYFYFCMHCTLSKCTVKNM